MTGNRQLAAIMFTDIVGYTALMGRDERKAMDQVRKNKEIQKPLVEHYNGIWLKEMGDGAMSSFTTASEAIYCAMEIQKSLNEDPDLKLRIGIHLGEVILEEGDVYGDGVNIASRIESITEPGGIYISDSVQKAIRGISDIQYVLLGELELKNVDYPVKTYALRGEFLPRPKKTQEKHLSGRLMAELQRRNVYRAGLAYLASAFILYSLLEFLNLNATTEYIIYALLILGVPLSTYLAWNYEKSPEGFVRVTSRKAWVNPYTATQKKPFTGNSVIIVLLLIIIGFIAYPRLSDMDVKESSLLLSEIRDKSIAVLPFENMSNDPDQEYFSNGITEDILNQLAKIKDLRVKSRTSTLQYKGTTKTIPVIGSELGVQHVLEGSVRKEGNQVRITAQLIHVETDEHIWSEVYDRDLTQIFVIQTEVAKEIARVLEIKLSSVEEEIIFSSGTDNITAYDYFLRAREIWNGTSSGSRSSIGDLLQLAISLDPGFAEAHALLSIFLNRSNWSSASPEIYFDSALALANKAIELDPDNPLGYVARGSILGNALGDRQQQGKDLEMAYSLEPNNPDVLDRLGWYLMQNGDPNRGAPMIIESIELNWNRKDPQYYQLWGEIYEYAKELDKARDLYLQAQKLAPDWNGIKGDLGWLDRLEGNYQRAIEYYTEIDAVDGIAWNNYFLGNLEKAEEAWLRMLESENELEDTTSFIPVRHRLGMLYWEQGNKEKAMIFLNDQIRLNQRDIDQTKVPVWGRSIGTSVYDLAITKAFIGKKEEALDIIEREDFFWGNLFWFRYYLESDPMLNSLRNEQRFKVVLTKWQETEEAARNTLRQLITEREASEQMRFQFDK